MPIDTYKLLCLRSSLRNDMVTSSLLGSYILVKYQVFTNFSNDFSQALPIAFRLMARNICLRLYWLLCLFEAVNHQKVYILKYSETHHSGKAAVLLINNSKITVTNGQQVMKDWASFCLSAVNSSIFMHICLLVYSCNRIFWYYFVFNSFSLAGDISCMYVYPRRYIHTCMH